MPEAVRSPGAPDAPRLVYLSDARIPSRSSNSMQVMRMCAAFAAAGCRVTLLHNANRGETPEGFDGDIHGFYGVPETFERIQLPGVRSADTRAGAAVNRLTRAAALTRALGRQILLGAEPKIVYARSFLGAWMALPLRRMRRDVALYIEVHDLPPSRRAWRVLRRVDGVITISAALRERLLAHGIPAGKVWVEHDGADVARFALPQTAPRGDAAPVVVYTGRAIAGKGVDVLIRAAARLEGTSARCVVVGKVYDPDYERVAGGNVEFTGFVPPAEVPAHVARADVLVMPTTPDLPYAEFTSPLKLFEYMASGRPVVASDLPVLREVLTHEHNALLYPPRDDEALAAAILRLQRDPDLASRLAGQARSDVSHYDWSARARRLTERMTAPGRDTP